MKTVGGGRLKMGSKPDFIGTQGQRKCPFLQCPSTRCQENSDSYTYTTDSVPSAVELELNK